MSEEQLEAAIAKQTDALGKMLAQIKAADTDALTAAVKHAANGKPWWVEFTKSIGVPAVLLLGIGAFVWIYGGQYLEKNMKMDEARQQEMSIYLQTQTTATEKLIDRSEKERDFEAGVVTVHENQQKTLSDIRDILKTAENTMAPVPELRQQELELLREIKTELEKE